MKSKTTPRGSGGLPFLLPSVSHTDRRTDGEQVAALAENYLTDRRIEKRYNRKEIKAGRKYHYFYHLFKLIFHKKKGFLLSS